MGVVQRQSIKRSILAYIGAFIGVGSQLWIYSKAFDVYGEFQFILAMITFFVPFASFGLIGLPNRFFPYFRDKNSRHNGFLGLLFLGCLSSYLVFLLFFIFFEESYFKLITHLGFNLDAFVSYNYIILACLFLAIFTTIMAAFCINFKRIVVPYALNSFSWKIFLPILILSYYFNYINAVTVYQSIFWVYLLIFISFILYLIRLGQFSIIPKFNKPFFKQYKSMIYFSLYGVVSTVGSIVAFRIDRIMIRGLIDDYNTGLYSSLVILAGLILFPYEALNGISTSFVSDAWKNKDIEGLGKLNSDICNLLVFAGFSIYFLMFLNLDDVFRLTNNYEDFKLGFNAFCFLGLAKAIDSSFGINGLILIYSKHYFLTFIINIILGASNITLNILLIPLYGITGAAFATASSILLYNVLIYLFNWYKFGIQGFDYRSMGILFILTIAFLLSASINLDVPLIFRIMVRTFIFLLFSIPVIWKFGLSPQFNIYCIDIIQQIKKRF